MNKKDYIGMSFWKCLRNGKVDIKTDSIVNEVKKQCNFRKITNVRYSKVKMSCYSCPDSRYKGLICFYKRSNMLGDETSTIVHHIEN